MQRAGDSSYIEYFRQRGRTPHWEDAFEDAFGIRPAAFYAEFAASRPEIERVVTGATLAQADAQDRDGFWVSTELFPGLNLVGWLEAPTPVGELFAAIPRAEALFVWNAADQTWQYAARSPRVPPGGLDLLQPGMGVWLRLGGSGAARWDRLVVPGDPKTVSLTGYTDLHRDGAFVAWVDSWQSLDVLGDDLLWIQRWDSSRQRWGAPHVPASAAFAQAVNDLRAGDGFWLATARSGLWRQAQARWWPDAAEPFDWIQSIDFWGDVSESERQRLRDHAAAVAAFSLERFGSSSTPQAACGSRSGGRGDNASKQCGAQAATPYCGGAATTNELTLIITCYGRRRGRCPVLSPTSISTRCKHERYRQSVPCERVRAGEGPGGPGWLIEGSAEWATLHVYGFDSSRRLCGWASGSRRGTLERTTETLRDARLFLQSGAHYATRHARDGALGRSFR